MLSIIYREVGNVKRIFDLLWILWIVNNCGVGAVIAPTVFSNIEVFIKSAAIATGKLERKLGIGEVNIGHLKASLDAGEHIVGTTGRVNHGLDAVELEEIVA